LQALLEAGDLTGGQQVRFIHCKHDGTEVTFSGRIRSDGIEVDGKVNSVSLAAIRCIESVGETRAANGWFAWETEEDVPLSELHRAWLCLQEKPRTSMQHVDEGCRVETCH
jgi:hypothetical protein